MLVLTGSADSLPDHSDPGVRYRLPTGLAPAAGPDGTPQVTPVWVDYDGRHVLVNSAAGRRKDLNMSARRRVAIEIADPDNPNRYVAVRGSVVEITEAGADEHLDRLARRYLGRERYPDSYRFPGEVRRIYKIVPEKVTTWDPFG
jgi:PPOX class probable F420-dependent enzyme